MNKKNSPRILLDTSFLLPMMGFETNRIVMDTIPLLRKCEVFYSDLSILEALWKIVKHIDTEEKMRIVLQGIELIEKTFSLAKLNSRALEIALKLYAMGHKDLIDDILYGLALSEKLLFLSIDRELRDFIEKNNLPKVIVNPTELKELINSKQ